MTSSVLLSQSQRGFFRLGILLAIILGISSFSSFYKIEPAQQGVVTRLGAFTHIAEEGPHFKLPFGIDQVFKVEVTSIHELQFGFRKGGEKLSPDQARLESLMLTGDLNVAVVEWILQYKINDPRQYLFHAANVEKTLRDGNISVMRRVVGDKLVSDVLTTDRVSIAQKAKELTQALIDKYQLGILITQINLQNVTPPEDVKPAFNEINIAKQEQEQLINQARGTYNKVIPEAEGQAQRLLSEAEAYAVDTLNRAKGDTARYKQLLVAYKASPQLTRKRLYIDAMEEILGEVDHLSIVDSSLKGILPLYRQQQGSVGSSGEVSPASTSSQSVKGAASQATSNETTPPNEASERQ